VGAGGGADGNRGPNTEEDISPVMTWRAFDRPFDRSLDWLLDRSIATRVRRDALRFWIWCWSHTTWPCLSLQQHRCGQDCNEEK
jgi:hypothetical protein